MYTSLFSRHRTIVILEACMDETQLVTRALRETLVNVHPLIVSGWEELEHMLARREGWEEIPLPELVILDMSFAGGRGREALQTLRTARTFSRVPVITMDNPTTEDEIRWTYDAHANCFVERPNEPARLHQVMSETFRFWFHTAVLPSRTAAAYVQ